MTTLKQQDLGPLVLRGPHGGATNMPFTHRSHYDQIYGKSERSSSQSFTPSLSTSSFFVRHSPHPFRVRHINGLNDAPICSVHDDLPDSQMKSTRYCRSLFTPERASGLQYNPYGIMPVDEMEMSLMLKKPRDIFCKPKIQGFGKPKYPGGDFTGPQTALWYSELRELSRRAGLIAPPQPTLAPRKQTGGYSPMTGRLNEPASVVRATPRGGLHMPQSARRTGDRYQTTYTVTAAEQLLEPNFDGLVLELLSTILQTDSISAIQKWLLTATDREKSLVSEMVRSALLQDEGQIQTGQWDDPNEFRQGNDENVEVERLVLGKKDEEMGEKDQEITSRPATERGREVTSRPLVSAREPVCKLPNIEEKAVEGSNKVDDKRIMSKEEVFDNFTRNISRALKSENAARVHLSAEPQKLQRRHSTKIGTATLKTIQEILENKE